MPLRSEPSLVENSTTISVVKVGGSLLCRPEIGPLLQAWLDSLETAHTVLIAGGGEQVEAIRVADTNQQLGQSASHWLAIEAMQQTAQQLSALIPEATFIKTFSELRQQLESSGITILDVHQFMREEEPNFPGLSLPEHWDVTSDSIAARLAVVLQANELVLLKSCSSASCQMSLKALADSGYVDPFLPRLRSELPKVRLVDLPGGREDCLTN